MFSGVSSPTKGGKENHLNLGKIKIGMVVCWESSDSWINRRIVEYQEKIGFSPPASLITHCAISIGGKYITEATWPKSKVGNIIEDYSGRKVYFLYHKSDQFRQKLRYKVALWSATKLNLNYGLLGLIGFRVRLLIPIFGGNPLYSKNYPFCSNLVVWAFRKEGYDICPQVATDLVTPAHIFSSPMFESVNVWD